MKAWTSPPSATYYLDPVILFLEVGARSHGDAGRVPTVRAGYYVAPHCDPDCCQAIGVDLGPFPTADQARRWSVKHLASID